MKEIKLVNGFLPVNADGVLFVRWVKSVRRKTVNGVVTAALYPLKEPGELPIEATGIYAEAWLQWAGLSEDGQE